MVLGIYLHFTLILWALVFPFKGVVIDKKGKKLTLKHKSIFLCIKPQKTNKVVCGDFVKGFASGGKAKLNSVKGKCIAGTVVFASSKKIILSNGTQVYLYLPKFFLNGKHTSSIPLGSRVYLRVNPTTGKAVRVDAINLKKYKSDFNVMRSVLYPPNKRIFKKGDTLKFVLQAKDGEYFIDILGVAYNLKMKRVGKNIYKTRFTFNKGDVRESYILIKKREKKKVLVRVYPYPIDVAISSPKVNIISPVPKRYAVPPPVVCTFQSEGTLINPKTVSVFLDGKPIRLKVRRIDLAFGYTPKTLTKGEHTLKVCVEDMAGNSSCKVVKFTTY